MGKNGFKKNKTGFTYYGDLTECIKIAERRLRNLQENTEYITRVYSEAKRRYETHLKAIESADDFIYLAKKKLEEKETEEVNNEKD